MLHSLTVIEDNAVAAKWSNDDERWHVTIFSALDGRQEEVKLTAQQFAAVQFLFFNGDEMTGPLEDWSNHIKAMYEIAEPLFDGLPESLRIIP